MLLFFTFGSGEIFLIIIMLVVVFGPKRIPTIARNLGKVINEMKTASSDFKNEINKEVQKLERETRYNEFLKEKELITKQTTAESEATQTTEEHSNTDEKPKENGSQ